jgi:hypothetical protein
MMQLKLLDVLLPTILAIGFLLVGWSSTRTINRGRPLPPHMKKALLYGSLFVLGMGYLMLFGGQLNWPNPILFASIAAWGVLLASIAWWRFRKAQSLSKTLHKPMSELFAEGFPALGLMIAAIGCAVEWEYVFNGQGRWWVGVLWLVGVSATIVLVGRNRRTTVIVVLRGIVALLIIGAVAERTSPAFIAAVTSGLVLLLLEKLWRNRSDGREVPFQSNR